MATDKFSIKMTLLNLNEGMAEGNTPPRVYVLIFTKKVSLHLSDKLRSSRYASIK